MMYLAWFNKDTHHVVGFRQLRDGDQLPQEHSDFDYLVVSRRPQVGDWLEAGEMKSRPAQPDPAHVWDSAARSWVFSNSALDQVKEEAATRIDTEAGSVRLRYITSVPGQAETYTRKEAQAREWAAQGFVADAPSFIAAEAQALGVEPQQIAQEVIALADFWSLQKGPEIEAARIAGKAAVRAAADGNAVLAAQAQAVQTLRAL